MAKAWLAFLIQVLISLSQSPVLVTLVPKYVNFSTSNRCLPSIMTGLFTGVSPQNMGLPCDDFETNSFG